MSEISEYLSVGRIVSIMRICAQQPPYELFGCSHVARLMSERTGEAFPKQTAMRILKALAFHGYINQTQDGKKFFRPRV